MRQPRRSPPDRPAQSSAPASSAPAATARANARPDNPPNPSHESPSPPSTAASSQTRARAPPPAAPWTNSSSPDPSTCFAPARPRRDPQRAPQLATPSLNGEAARHSDAPAKPAQTCHPLRSRSRPAPGGIEEDDTANKSRGGLSPSRGPGRGLPAQHLNLLRPSSRSARWSQGHHPAKFSEQSSAHTATRPARGLLRPPAGSKQARRITTGPAALRARRHRPTDDLQ